MKEKLITRITIGCGLAIAMYFVSCTPQEADSQEDHSEEKSAEKQPSHIFEKGVKAPSEYFTGTAWVQGLVENDSVFTTAAGNVMFEPQARSNWHAHPSGQLLLVTAGKGYHQIKGQPKEVIRKGDVIKCPPNVMHWHGASTDSSMTHIYIVPNTEKGIVEWADPVSDETFLNN